MENYLASDHSVASDLTSHLRHQTKSFALNQSESDTIVSFDVDQVSGALAANGQVIKTGSPVCMIFKTS